MIRAVLFDAAGTLIAPREPVGETYARHAEKQGLDISAWRLGDAFARVFASMPPAVFPELSGEALAHAERDWWFQLVRQTFLSADSAERPADFTALFDGLWSAYADPAHWRVRAGAAALLDRLRAEGRATGVVSNFDGRLPHLLEGLGLASRLDATILPRDAGAAKPDPAIFAYALARLGVAPEAALFVGDHPEEDLAGARAAGLRAVDVTSLATLTDLEVPA